MKTKQLFKTQMTWISADNPRQSALSAFYLTLVAVTLCACVYKGELLDPKLAGGTTVKITISQHPVSITNVTAGSIIGSLTVEATADDENAKLNYQWYSATSNSNVGGTEIAGAGAKTAIFSIPKTLTAAGSPYYYFCEVRATGATPERSNVATVNVSPEGTPLINITTHPAASTNVTLGNITGNLSVIATVTQGATISYQWYSNTSSSKEGGSEITGETNASFTIPKTLSLTGSPYFYFCEVRATGGAAPARSNVARVNVTATASTDMIETVLVQGGSFSMGANGQVTISGFYMGAYPITQAQWITVMGTNPSAATAGIGDNYPVNMVSWNDIVGTEGTAEHAFTVNKISYYKNGFIYKLNQLTGKNYRLPTEAEWEFAARGGTKNENFTYSGSNTIGDVAWWSENTAYSYSTQPVGRKLPNGLGIYDMSGNVWEWCGDWFGNYTGTSKTDPTGPDDGMYRVRRGGSWCSMTAAECSVTSREGKPPIQKDDFDGLRVAMNYTAPGVAPTVSTSSEINCTATTATVCGNITNAGTPAYTERGVKYTTTNTTDPNTVNLKKIVAGSGTTGSFCADLDELDPNTTYYVWAYATNTAGTGYGTRREFITTGNKPTVSTNAATGITATSATIGGKIVSVGSPAYSAKGVAYSKTSIADTKEPETVENYKTVTGTGTGDYSVTVEGLSIFTKYYVRAYAKNTEGHAYGQEVEFTTDKATLSGTVTIDGNAIFGQTLTANTAALTSTPVISDKGVLSYQWRRGTTNIGGANSSTYTLMQADIGYAINVVVTAANCISSVTSSNTAAVTKATPAAPTAPTMVNATTTSITLVAVAGYEYNRNDGAWQTSATFSGLTANTSYTFKQRIAETATHLASPASAGATIASSFIVPSAGIEMVSVQGGTFQMGQTGVVTPVHEVTVSSFTIGKYEITQKQWIDVMGSWPATAPSKTYGVGNNYPAYNVSWNDIVGTSASAEGYTVNDITYYQNGFCYKLSQMAGGGKQYRLPTEAEWEYAARGGNAVKNCTGGCEYSGSNTVGDVAWYSVNSYDLGEGHPDYGTHTVGTKIHNELGTSDMSGNVYEWCGDWYGTYSSAAQTNPTGPTSGSYRVYRGGSWFKDATYARVAARDFNNPTFRYVSIGFRLACSTN